MKLLDINSIEIRNRTRELNAENIAQLEDSIVSKGLLHAPVVAKESTGITFLVAGLHRMEAMVRLHKTKKKFTYDGVVVPEGQVPTVFVTDLSPADLLEAELEENIIRAPIPWQDRARAIAAIHELRVADNPKQSFIDTAREIQAKTSSSTSTDPQRIRQAVRNSVILSEHLHKPSIAKARNASEALTLVYKEQEAAIFEEIAKRRKSDAPPNVTAMHGDMTVVLPSLQPEQFDLIVADLPYGIEAGAIGNRQRTMHHHNYEDTPDEARRLLDCVLQDGFRVAKSRANLLVFGDVDLFPYFKRAASAMGWKPFRTPIVWRKSNEGNAPWGREGPRRTYELVFFATKGNRGLHQSPTDVLDISRVSRNERDYGAEKPVELLKRLIEVASMPGDYVLDPCCGSGSTLAACRESGRRGLGIELDEYAYNLAVGRASGNIVEEEDSGLDEDPAQSLTEDLV